MQYTVNRGEKGKVELKVDIPATAFNQAYDQVLGQLGRDLKVSGFRPGKIPASVAESHLGTGRLLNETANFLVSKHLGDIFKTEEIVPIVNPSIAVETLTKGSPFSFTVTLTQRPKIKVSDWKKLRVAKVKAKEVTGEDIDKSIENIHEAYIKNSKLKTPLQKFSGQANSKLQIENSNEEEETEESSKKFISEQSEEAKGSADPNRVRVEKAFIYDARGEKVFLKDDGGSPSAHVGDERKPFDSAQGDFTSGINDEFAKAVGAQSILHLKELVKKDLETIIADQVQAKLEEEVFDKILEFGDLEIPDLLIDDELNRILVRLNQQLEGQGKKLDDFLAEEKLTIDELKVKWRPQSEKNVKITLIMDEIGTAEKIQVTPEELENAFGGVNQTDLTPDQKMDLKRYLAVSIFQAKTLDLVKKIVTS